MYENFRKSNFLPTKSINIMRFFRKIIAVILLAITGNVFGQPESYFRERLAGGGDPKAVYERAAQLSEKAAEKYDALGCTASAAYCRKIVRWNRCMLSNLAGNSCGLQPLPENAPKCDAATIGGANSAASSDPFKQMQLKQQQTQQELTNAQNASMSAYEAAINSGKKTSGAIFDATIAGAQQISSGTGQLLYTGVGFGISLFVRLAEKKAEKKEKEDAIIREAERKQLIIDTKTAFFKEALDINQYNFSDLISKDRFATILLVPNEYDSEEQNIYFSSPIQVIKYSDDTYPLKPDIEKKLLAALDKNTIKNKKVFTLYPITNLEKFTNDFVKKMGSGKVIFLNAELLTFLKDPFPANNQQNEQTDFWDSSLKKKDTTIKKTNKELPSNKPPQKTIKAKDDFWNN